MWVLKSFLLALSLVPLKLLGMILIPIGLKFKQEYPETAKPFTQYPERGNWRLVRLPSWLKWFDNQYDGFLGDKRGWWANECDGKHETLKCMWLWGAVRNPTNYFNRSVISLDVSKCRIVKLAGNCDLPSEEPGMREWVHLCAFHESGKEYHRFFMSWAIINDHGIMIDIGYKIKLSQNGTPTDAPDKDRLRSPVFSPSPWKKLT